MPASCKQCKSSTGCMKKTCFTYCHVFNEHHYKLIGALNYVELRACMLQILLLWQKLFCHISLIYLLWYNYFVLLETWLSKRHSALEIRACMCITNVIIQFDRIRSTYWKTGHRIVITQGGHSGIQRVLISAIILASWFGFVTCFQPLKLYDINGQ